MNNKKVVLLITLIIVLSLSFGIVYLINSTKNITCELNKDNYNIIINLDKNNINFDYKYNFDTIEKSVDKFDMMSSYIDFIVKLDGVEADINQNKNILEYSIKVDIENVSNDNYKLLEVDKVIGLGNKEIIKYYEDLGYTCK